jgi:hypothetical protein
MMSAYRSKSRKSRSTRKGKAPLRKGGIRFGGLVPFLGGSTVSWKKPKSYKSSRSRAFSWTRFC